MWILQKWDKALEQKAQAWADKCVFQHSQGRGDVGENLFQGTSSSNEDAFKQAAASWWEELTTKGASAQDTKYTVEEFNRGNGHWSQMAWAKSVKLGCGAKDCGNPIPGTMVVCNYQVAGNLLDTTVYDKGEPCKSDAECTTIAGSKCDTKSRLCEAP
ncbi:venom allergen-like protein vap-2 [Aphelenchoides avenae]|nr:venom allergen-like protein vap-2 [Aphelenchus avenae]